MCATGLLSLQSNRRNLVRPTGVHPMNPPDQSPTEIESLNSTRQSQDNFRSTTDSQHFMPHQQTGAPSPKFFSTLNEELSAV
jgi:hypothetical protein